MQSELFEAYVAAFEHEHGYQAVFAWLTDLYTPLIHNLVKTIKIKPAKAPPVKDGVVTHTPAKGQQSYVNLRAYLNSTNRFLNTKFAKRKTADGAKQYICTLTCGKYLAVGQGATQKVASEV